MDLLEFQKADMNDQLWDIKSDVLRVETRLEKGDRIIKDLREDLDVHVDDPNAHQPLPRDDRRYFGDPEEHLTDHWLRYGSIPILSSRQKRGLGGGAVGTVITIIYVLHELGVI